PAVCVEAPLDYRSIMRADPELALAWRLHLRRVMSELFDAGYVLVGCTADSCRGRYVFTKSSQDARL
ncbi:MAG: hypothetical protein M3281_09485, partial [Chloroflexota bacterium]|nr:hypothetical protein [Chloroflexota bacterium]